MKASRVAPAPVQPTSTGAVATRPAGFFNPGGPADVVTNYFKKFEDTDKIEIVAQLKQQADLSKLASSNLSRADRRAAAWDALRQVADDTQKPVATMLEGYKKDGLIDKFQGFALGNQFEIQAPRASWEKVFRGLQKSGNMGLVIAFDGKGMLAEMPDAPEKIPARPTKVEDDPTQYLKRPSQEQLKERADKVKAIYTKGPKDPDTWLIRPEDGVAWNVAQVGADKAWAQGITGKGVNVGVIDTGADARHPGIAHALGAPDDPYRWYGDAAKKGDAEGHGSHVAGTIAGGTKETKIRTGLAPDANLMIASMNDSITGAFQWMLAPGPKDDQAKADARRGADIISNSWGMPDPLNDVGRMLKLPLKQLNQAGVVTVFAAGNSGPGTGTALAPGSDPSVITIGATRRDGTIANFSSRGLNNPKDPTPKPDVAAPGAEVPSSVPISNVADLLPLTGLLTGALGDALPDSPEAKDQRPVPGTGGSYWYFDGTSMATPTTSGAIALLLQKYPQLSPADVKNVLKRSSIDMGPEGRDAAYGAGRIDLMRAFASADRLVARRAKQG